MVKAELGRNKVLTHTATEADCELWDGRSKQHHRPNDTATESSSETETSGHQGPRARRTGRQLPFALRIFNLEP